MKTDLEKLEALERAATKGELYDSYCKAFRNVGDDCEIVFEVPRVAGDTPTIQGERDLRFLVALRNEVPAMIQELRKLRAEVERLRAQLATAREDAIHSCVDVLRTAPLGEPEDTPLLMKFAVKMLELKKTTKGGGA